MKNILIFCHDYSLSGANRSLLDYLKNYNRQKYNVIVVIPRKKSDFFQELQLNNIIVYNLPYININKKIYKTNFKTKIKDCLKYLYNILLYFNFNYKIKKIIKKHNINSIITNSFSCVKCASIAVKLNINHTFHIREFMELDHKIKHINEKKIKFLTSNSNAIFISNSIKDYYINKYKFLKYKVIYDQVNRIKFEKSRALFEDGINILIAGILQENKGQLDVIRAVQLLNKKYKINLYICGDGPQREILQEYVKKNNLKNIYFKGLLSYSELLDLRKNIDISVVASKCEALGRVTIESMYYFSYTIGTNSGETKFLLDNNRGMTYSFGNYQQLASCIDYAFKHKDEIAESIENAHFYAINNFEKNITNEILSYSYKEVKS